MTLSLHRLDHDRPCLITFHAHPDDEAIFTGGTIALAVAAGWRVVLVVATSGEEGAIPAWLDEDLGRNRRAETVASARCLGIERVEFLGYRDSGDVSPGPDDPVSLHPDGSAWGPARALTLDAAPFDAPVWQLRRILSDEHAAALTSYDATGIYGHRDHVRVHQIAAAAVIGTGCDLVEATVGRGTLSRLRHELLGRGLDPGSWPQTLVDVIGSDEDAGLIPVDVSEYLADKWAAIAAHASQVVEASTFMGLPPGVFHQLLGLEWFHLARTVDGRLAQLLVAHRCLSPANTPDAQIGRTNPRNRLAHLVNH